MLNFDEFEIITVNYNTPQLIKKLIESRDKFYPRVKLRIIDGSDSLIKIIQLRLALKKHKNYVVRHQFKNIHHGKGLHKGILESNKEFLLLFDSDSFFVDNGGLEYLKKLLDCDERNYMVSNICYVNKGGIDKPKTPNEKKHYRYPHPSICLIKRRAYLVSPYKFINHGAPAINIAIGLDTEKDSKILVDAPEIFSYFGTQRRGTVSIYGYNYKKVPWEETIS